MGFKSGAAWNGNSKGAPKRGFARDDLTEKMVKEREDDIREVTDILFDNAKANQPWAIKLICMYSYTVPKSRNEAEDDVYDKIKGILDEMSRDKLIQAQKLLMSEMSNDTANTPPQHI